ncbi:MAG TPA: hypothetical protein VMV89_06925 [Candidatus Paceibacterota bacterium]|nr:hypothetical protein [Candidatus Paceibacterota bacterium]
MKQTDGGAKPWLVRADWAAGKIKPTSTAPVGFLLLWAFLALAMSAPAIHAIPTEWRKGNHAILVALLFPAVAIYLLGFSFVKWRSRRRFGDCFFEPAQIPAPLGGTLEGMIQTGAPLKLEQGLHLKISCIRRTVSATGAGNNRRDNIQETVLWQDEKILAPNAGLPEPEPGHTGIPVHFKLPADQPECFAIGNDSVFWRLEAKSKMRGPDFSVAFDVPVFKVAGVIAEAADEPDPTTSLQEPVEEVRRDEHSKIRVSNGPNGREFYFPAARNLGTSFGLTFFFLAWTGATLAAYFLFKSRLFEIVFTAVDILLFIICFNLWFKSSRVAIDSTGVRVTKHWLLLSRSRTFAASDIVRFDTKAGMTSGTTVFYDLKLVTKGSEDSFAAAKEGYQQTGQRPPLKFPASSSGGFTLASGIASKPEATWLVQEMTKALAGRHKNFSANPANPLRSLPIGERQIKI